MKTFRAIAFIVIACASIVFAICISTEYIGGWESNSTYGGEAYTGIQNAAASTARNVERSNEIMRMGFGGVFALAGAVLLVIGISSFPRKKDNMVGQYQQVGESYAPQTHVVPPMPTSTPKVPPLNR